jgi:SnoaL-like polyketide cyclase
MKSIFVLFATLSLNISVVFVPESFGQYAGIAKYRQDERNTNEHLAKLDTLDFRVFTHRQWDRLKESHAKDIVVHWPDGRHAKGLARHTDDLKAMFVYAPDIRVRVHSVKFGSHDWTCVIGKMEGTFTRPMLTAGGKAIPPNGKPFEITMCVVDHWNKSGLIKEEYLFWDNQSLMRQIGAK